MIITTTPSIEGKKIVRYIDIVGGDAIMGTNIFRDIFAGVRDIVGGRSATYERAVMEAKELALKEMQEEAENLGANAVVGVDLDYETIGRNGSMLMVSVSGTAVVVE
jgi:uncharacterized protein YbjQ (UPF0145 family)